MLRPGDLLGERYEIVEQIGGGGMGTLWRARHVELHIDVALKVIATRSASDGALKRFKREARSAAKLHSPNIVRIIDFGEFKGQPYLAMELLRGEDLAVRLAREGPLPFDACRRIIAGIASAVQVAHAAGIVHRDLKPANVFLERGADGDVVKILDFGVAKDLNAPTEPGSTTALGMVGSPAYMSPEQVWNQEVSPQADVWAMGVITLEMLTGKNPFADETLAKIFERIIRDPLPVPSSLRADLPPSLDAFFIRALSRSAKDRIGSAREFSEGLAAALDGREPPARSRHELPKEPAPETAARAAVTARTRRGRSLRPLMLGLILAALAAAGVGLALSHGTRPEPTAQAAASILPSPPASSPPRSLDPASPAPSPSPSATAGLPPTPRRKVLDDTPHKARAPLAPATTQPLAASSAPPPPAPSAAVLDPRFGIPLGR
jgi:serine/threonine-protein kinase